MNLPTSNGAQPSLASRLRPRAAAFGILPQAWLQQWQLHSEPLRLWWQSLASRERQGLRWALRGGVTALLITLAVLPAWRTLKVAPAQLTLVEGQLQQMNQLASQARLLRAAPVISMARSMEALKAASERLGSVAILNLQGQQAVMTFNGVAPEALLEWLRETRTVGRVRVIEAKLTRTGTTYSGSVLMTLAGAAP
jgi:general secretion pathway protein M